MVMKRWNTLLNTMRFPIKLILLAFILIELGSIIQNRNVNIFYTINNSTMTIISEILIKLGEVIVVNFPLIVIVRFVSRRAKSGTPVLIALIGYFTFLIFTTFFQNPTMSSLAFFSIFGIEYNATNIANAATGIRHPIQTGLIGALIVGIISRYSYVKSRRRSPYSVFAFLDKDTVGYIYNIIFCALAGFLVAKLWPYLIFGIEKVVGLIANDISNPKNIALYGFLDRLLSTLGLGDLIRRPFWFGVAGGSLSTFSGQNIFGDVAIWTKLSEFKESTLGYGRFITPYYILNMFVIPSMLIALYRSNTRKSERRKSLVVLLFLILASFIYGNPLPLELALFFGAPLLYFGYLALTATLFGLLQYLEVYLGFSYSGSTIIAMPGSFPDYIILLRNNQYSNALIIIFALGLLAAIIYYLLTYIYIQCLAFDLFSIKKKVLAVKIIDGVGGIENIQEIYSSPSKLSLVIKDLELIDVEALIALDAPKISEVSDGLVIYYGMSSAIIRKQIEEVIKEHQRN